MRYQVWELGRYNGIFVVGISWAAQGKKLVQLGWLSLVLYNLASLLCCLYLGKEHRVVDTVAGFQVLGRFKRPLLRWYEHIEGRSFLTI